VSATAVGAPARPAPFKGLVPYTEEDASFFFGRDEEIEVVIANLEARRLTLLYGESGAGKSSLLRAGVSHRLLETARRNLEEIGTPELVPVYFASWRDDPLEALLEAIGAATSSITGEAAADSPHSRRLDEAIERASAHAQADILVVLDQFEEYFLYHEVERSERTFADELPRAVNNPGLHARFVLAIREDTLAKLDRFKREIPSLFGTYLRVRHLDRNAAQQAIERPIEEYNRLGSAGDEHVEIEPGLVEAVLDQVTAGRVVLEQAGLGAGIDDATAAEERIEAPYLQLVMTRLWSEEMGSGSRILRRSTLDRLGGAERIVSTHLDEAMNVLSPSERHIAASVFRYLVTPSGTKIAYTPADLAAYVSLAEDEIRPVLTRLAGREVRILRPVSTGRDQDGATRFEIFHDVLAGVVLDWRARYLKDRELVDAVRWGVARVVLGLIGFFLIWFNIAFIGLGLAESASYFFGLIWSVPASAIWLVAMRSLRRRWTRRQRGLWLAVTLGVAATVGGPVSLIPLGVLGLERRAATRPAADAAEISPASGPPGRRRGIGFGILLFFVTFGFYGCYWSYRTEEEMRQHTGDGLGGVVGLLIWILLSPVMAFVIPSEIGKMYTRAGQKPPVTGWTGLWLFPLGAFLIPAIVWFVRVQGALNRYWAGVSVGPGR
jgi:Novel STAND NTPase 1/Domain of unknown function (DUF4234)